jgi:hypothetical protein
MSVVSKAIAPSPSKVTYLGRKKASRFDGVMAQFDQECANLNEQIAEIKAQGDYLTSGQVESDTKNGKVYWRYRTFKRVGKGKYRRKGVPLKGSQVGEYRAMLDRGDRIKKLQTQLKKVEQRREKAMNALARLAQKV